MNERKYQRNREILRLREQGHSIRAIASTAVDYETQVSRYANHVAFYNVNSGLLTGPMHPKYQESKVAVQAKIQAIQKWEEEHPEESVAAESLEDSGS